MNIIRRSVLLSTGELVDEIALVLDDRTEIHESCPWGATVGVKEAPTKIIDDQALQVLLDSLDFSLSQKDFDERLQSSGTGANITTPISLIHLRYLAHRANMPLHRFISSYYKTESKTPVPILNIMNGGKHAGNHLAMCEFMIIPKAASTRDRIRIASDVYQDLKGIVEEELGVSHTMVGREGGLAPRIYTTEEALALVEQAIDKRHKKECAIAIDVAANNFSRRYGDHFTYTIDGNMFTAEHFASFYKDLAKKHPRIEYIEDPLHEEDKEGWRRLMDVLSRKVFIVADDLTTTNKNYAEANKGLFNGIILKTNQIGTFTGLVETFFWAKEHGVQIIASQRSGETDTPTLSHIAYGLGADYIKAGSPARERIIKYNELARIAP